MIFNPIVVGGTKLPTLTDPGTAADLLAPKQLIDAEGNVLTGTMPEIEQATTFYHGIVCGSDYGQRHSGRGLCNRRN